MTAYNFHVYDNGNDNEIAWGTFQTEQELNEAELAHKANLLGDAMYDDRNIKIEMYLCDNTSGDFDNLGTLPVITYYLRGWLR